MNFDDLHEVIVDPALPVAEAVPGDVQRALRRLQGSASARRTVSLTVINSAMTTIATNANYCLTLSKTSINADL